MKVLGIDTSNYTTSVAVFDGADMKMNKILLDSGDMPGLRQRDALFQHTKNLPLLFEKAEKGPYAAVGASDRPRNVEGSYMPCFLAGVSAASSAAAASGAPIYRFSHQEGHIAAALYSIGRRDLFEEGKAFYAFHLSGGTTELLKVVSRGDGFDAEIVAATADISAGQVLDRVGVALGYGFPAGAAVDKAALSSDKSDYLKCFGRGRFNFSGVENKAAEMIKRGAPEADVARYAVLSVAYAVKEALSRITETVIMSGGVSSSEILRKVLKEKENVLFAAPGYSADNAAGIAILTYLKAKKEK